MLLFKLSYIYPTFPTRFNPFIHPVLLIRYCILLQVKKNAVKISKVKRGNQKRTKLSRQGKLKTRRHKKADSKPKPKPKQQEHEEEGSDTGEGMLEMVEGDDLAYLKNAISAQSYQLLKKIRSSEYV